MVSYTGTSPWSPIGRGIPDVVTARPSADSGRTYPSLCTRVPLTRVSTSPSSSSITDVVGVTCIFFFPTSRSIRSEGRDPKGSPVWCVGPLITLTLSFLGIHVK